MLLRLHAVVHLIYFGVLHAVHAVLFWDCTSVILNKIKHILVKFNSSKQLHGICFLDATCMYMHVILACTV